MATKVGSEVMEHLAPNLPSTLTSLDISWNNIGCKGMKTLFSYLENISLTTLKMGISAIDHEKMKYLASHIPTTLTSLDIYWNNIGNEGAKHLSQCLEKTKLTYLNMDTTNIASEGIKLLSPNLEKTKLISLDMGNNNIGDEGMKYLALPNTLTSLDTRCNNISSYGMITLSQNLPQTSLTLLDISGNNIGDEGMMYLSQNLPQTSLTTLDIRSNNIGEEGMKCLFQNLRQTSLTTLNIRGNKIGDEGMKCLFQNLPHTRLTTLNISYNNIGDEGMKCLFQNLRQTSLTTLNIRGNKIGDKVYLPYSNLTLLDISNNEINDEGVKRLFQHLHQSKLTTLDLDSNNISSECVRSLGPHLSRTKLNYFYVGHKDLDLKDTDIVWSDNGKTPLWYECNYLLERLANVLSPFNNDESFHDTLSHKYAMLALAKEKGGEYLLTLKYSYLMFAYASFLKKENEGKGEEKEDQIWLNKTLSGDVSKKAKEFFDNEGLLIEMMSVFIKYGFMSGLDEMTHLLTHEVCVKYLLESCKKYPDLIDTVTTKMFCLSLIDECPDLFPSGRYPPYALRYAVGNLACPNPEETISDKQEKGVSYYDPVSKEKVPFDFYAFTFHTSTLLRNCIASDYFFSEE